MPTSGRLELVEPDSLAVTVGQINRAITDRHRTYPALAAHPALAPNQKAALLKRDRDLSGGIPERD